MTKAVPLLIAALLSAGCKKDSDTSERRGPAPAASADAGTFRAEDAFKVELGVPPSVGAGPSTMTVAITVKPGFHLNAEYPHAFRVDETSPGISLRERNELKDPLEKTACADFPDDVCAAKFAIPFEATANGTQEIKGTLALSVCNPTVCLIERVPLSTTVDVR